MNYPCDISLTLDWNPELPEQNYVISIAEGKYKGTVVSANSLDEAFKELGKSIIAIEVYRDKMRYKLA